MGFDEITAMASPSATECPICNEEYDEEEWCPRVLPCSHTLCTKCIENLISKNSKKCPSCRQGFKARVPRDVGANTSLLDVLKLLRETKLALDSLSVVDVGKPSNRVNDLKRETDEIINKVLFSAQETENEIDQNILSNDDLENSLIRENEIMSDLQRENNKRIQYLREHSRRLKSHKISINETSQVLRTAKNKLTSAGTFMQIAEVADDVERRKTYTEKHLHSLMGHMAEDEKTRLKLQQVVNLTRDPIEKLGKIVQSSGIDKESNFTPDINHLQISDVIAEAIPIESLQSKSHSVMEIIRKGQIFGVQELEGRKRFAQITMDNQNRICLHHLKEQNIPPDAHLIKHSDIVKLMDVSSRLVFLEVSEKELLGRIYIRLSPQTKRANQFALLCTGEKGVSYVQSHLLAISNEWVLGGDYGNLKGSGGKALVTDSWKEEGGVLKRRLKAGLIWGRNPGFGESQASQFYINTKDRPEVELDWCFGMVEEGLHIIQKKIQRYRKDITKVVFSDAGIVIPI